jgi:hypothetical protein
VKKIEWGPKLGWGGGTYGLHFPPLHFTLNEGGRGPVLIVSPKIVYVALWITPEYNWRFFWGRTTWWNHHKEKDS